MLEWLKWAIARDEMEKLNRYQQACNLVWRWNGQVKSSSDTAYWINQVGEGKQGMDIVGFREKLFKENGIQ